MYGVIRKSCRLFLHTYFLNCRRTLLKLNSKGPYRSSEREITFRRCLFVFSIKREILAFSRAKSAKNCTKKCDAHAKLLFCLHIKSYFFKFLTRSRCWIKSSYCDSFAYDKLPPHDLLIRFPLVNGSCLFERRRCHYW